jgi:DNA-binding PadR family transcriptional regulator
MFYILLCLKRECCGMDIMDRVPAMTAGRVKVGPGTLYNLLDQFLEADMIRQTGMDGRRIRYILTQKGIEALQTEYQRLQWQMRDFDRVIGKEDA